MCDGMMQPMNGMNGQMNGMMGNMNGQMMNGMNGGPGMNGMMGSMNGGQWVQTPQGPMMVMWTGDSNGSVILQTPDGNQMMGQTMQMPDGTCCVGMMMPVQQQQQQQMMNGPMSEEGPRWVACAMVSQLEFVHPETRAPLRRGDVESLEKAVQKQPAARRLPFSVLRAFELAQSQEGSKNWADGEELEEFQAAANAELEAMRAAAEKEERDRPESTARAERAAASSADGPTDKAEKEEDGWVTTKSRARRPAPTATQAPIPTHLFPYSRKFVQALLTDAKGATTPCVWVQRIEQQLLRLVNPAGGVRPSAANPPSVHFPPLVAQRRAMLHEICGHFGLQTQVDITDGPEASGPGQQQPLRPMLVSWTEQAMVPHTLPSKVAQVFASPADRMFVQEAKFDPSSHEAGVHYVYVPDSTREAVTAKVDQDFAADTAPQVTDLGGGHMLVQFSSKLSAQKFLLARRAE